MNDPAGLQLAPFQLTARAYMQGRPDIHVLILGRLRPSKSLSSTQVQSVCRPAGRHLAAHQFLQALMGECLIENLKVRYFIMNNKDTNETGQMLFVLLL